MIETGPPVSGLPCRRKRPLIITAILSTLILAAVFSQPAMASSRAEKNQDTVFLVDISSSMRDTFDDVKSAILDYVRQAHLGDNITLISFGESVTLRIRRRISSEKDIEIIERELATLAPNEYFTNITGALERGMEELRMLDRKYPDHMRTIVLMSDGKNNPPDTVVDPMTFDEILERYPLLTKQGESTFFYLSLGENPDPQVMSFIESVEGLSFDLGKETADLVEKRQPLAFAQVFVEPVSIDLGTVLGPKASVPVSLAFFPARGDPSGNIITLSIRARFKANPSWKTVMEVRPAAFNCSGKPWSESLFFKIDSAEEGTIVGTLELKPLPGQVLFIEPPEIPVTMTIRQPYVEVAMKGILEFGPVDPRAPFKETQRVRLIPNPAAEEEPLRATSGIVVPEGMSVAAKIEKSKGIQELVVIVSTDESFDPLHSMTIEGAITLSGVKHALSFSKNQVEMRIEVTPPGATSRPITVSIGEFFSRFGDLLTYAIIAVLLAAVLGAGGYYWIKVRPQSALEGKLVLINLKGKKRDKSKMTTVNLHAIGRSVGRDSIVLGSSKDATITLPHKSVARHHLEIYAVMDKGKKRIFAEPIGKNFMIINLQKITKPTPLSDKDLIEIGAYTFRFENPHPYKQIVVRYLDGRIEKGTPATWDIESDGFGLLPRDALPGSTEEIYVPFSDLKAVYFVRDFDGRIGKKLVSPESQIHGKHMKLTFHDNEEIVGFTTATYNPVSSRFYFFPTDQTGNTISMVVERENLLNIETLNPMDET